MRFLTASRVARCAALREKQPLAEGIKRGGACLSAHNRSSFQRHVPSHPQGFWLAETGGTVIAGCAQIFSKRHGLFAGLRCTDADVAVSSEPSSAELLLTPENAERKTSLAKKFLPSIGTIMI
jgi:hypothetical protein